MTEIRTLTRNGEVFYPLTHNEAVIGMNEFKETIINQVTQYKPIEITGDVTNAPDEEDLTTDANNLLKFKDRNNLYGLGKVILRRDKTFSAQVTLANTIYVIQYNFDLNNGRVVLPLGAILLFEGGSVNNGTLVGSGNRLVYYQELDEIMTDLVLEGTFVYKACDKDTIGSISVDNSSIEENGLGQLSVKAGGIQNTHLNGNVVDQTGLVLDSNNKISIKDSGITNSKLDTSIVDNSSIALDSNNKISIKTSGVQGINLNSNIVNTDDLIYDNTNHNIKFADREYNSLSPNGMGKVILRNNIVNEVNTLTQSMINQTNTIYVIKYDFDLGGETITFPANCILDFQGGSLTNGVIASTDKSLRINALPTQKIFSTTLSCHYSCLNVDDVYPQWWGAIGDGVTDDSDAFQCALDTFRNVCIIFSAPFNYLITKTLVVKCSHQIIHGDNGLGVFGGGTSSRIQGGTIIFNPADDNNKVLFDCNRNDTIQLTNIHFEGLNINAANNDIAEIAIESVHSVADKDMEIFRCRFNNFSTAINIKGRGCTISECHFSGANFFIGNWDNSEQTGSHPAETGQRAYIFKNNKLHNVSGCCFDIQSGNAYGLVCQGNVCDNKVRYFIRNSSEVVEGTAQFKYKAWNWNISGNLLQACLNDALPIQLYQPEGTIVCDNIISSYNGVYQGETGIYKMTRAIIVYNAISLVIKSNYIDNCTSHAIRLFGINNNVSIVGNVMTHVQDTVTSTSGYIRIDSYPDGVFPELHNSIIADNIGDSLSEVLYFIHSASNTGRPKIYDSVIKDNTYKGISLCLDTRTMFYSSCLINDYKFNIGDTRPANPNPYMQFFDTTLNKLIYWNGTAWVDATGNPI